MYAALASSAPKVPTFLLFRVAIASSDEFLEVGSSVISSVSESVRFIFGLSKLGIGVELGTEERNGDGEGAT